MKKTFTIDEMVAEVEKEISMREHVYWKRVREGKMAPTMAQRGIDVMRAILEVLKEKQQEKQLKLL
jgi:hypothetical protein